jgi:probable F420-dependent oxidoreductase
MQFGLSTLSRGLFTSRAAYRSVAQAAERAGFAFLSVNDHIVVPVKLDSPYPYSAGGQWSAAEQGHCLEQLATLSFLAGCTERLRLLTSVMVVPHREPILAAKMLATIDVLSEGRLIVGVGAGWMAEEFRLLGAPFAERGAATTEYLEAFKALWTMDRPAYRGEHVAFGDLIFEPKPIQKPHPPVWIGGESKAALRRLVRVGDAWYPGNNNPAAPLDTPERLTAGLSELRKLAREAGRDPASIGITLLVQGAYDWQPARTRDGSARAFFTGTSAEMAADCATLAGLGIGHVGLRASGTTMPEVIERIERFGAEVIARTGG